MAFLKLLYALAFTLCTSNAAFNVFSGFDSTVQIAYGISTQCLAALNTTIACDEANAKMAAQGMDDNYWYKENITTLCVAQCQTSMTSWLKLVQTDCATDTVTQAGIVVKAEAIPLQYTHAVDLACLQNTAKDWCFLNSQTWVGNDYVRYDEAMCAVDDSPAICDDVDFDVEVLDPSLQSIIGLYDKSLYCDECFLKVWRQRLLSPFLVNGNWTQYRVDAFEELQEGCSIAMPYVTTAYSLYVGIPTTAPASASSYALPLCSFDPSVGENICPSATVTTSSTVSIATCTGQVVQPPLQFRGCNRLSDQYHVSTGDLKVITNDICTFDSAICLPLPCETKAIESYDETCTSLAKQISNLTHKITQEQFMSWNPHLMGSCDGVALGQRICTSPPGGHWVSNATIISPPNGAPVYLTTAIPAWPTQSGSIANCGRYHEVVNGDTCNLICLIYGITFAALRKVNSYLNVDCTNLWLKSSVCVGEVMYQQPVSTDGTCGLAVSNATCTGSTFGSCCSTAGWCGDGLDFCSPDMCSSGACTGSPTSTKDGSCGPNVGGLTCDNPRFGPCCSIHGYCGSGDLYCGTGNCYSGACNADVGGPSITGECGPLFQGNKTCAGTQFGPCCSVSGYCGSGDPWCKGTNCYSGACTV